MMRLGEGIQLSKSDAFLCALAAVDWFAQTQPVTAPPTTSARMFAEGIHAGGVDEKTAMYPTQGTSLLGVPVFCSRRIWN